MESKEWTVKRLNGSLEEVSARGQGSTTRWARTAQEQSGKRSMSRSGATTSWECCSIDSAFAPQVTKPRTRCKTRRMGSITNSYSRVLRGCCNFRNPPTLSVTYLSGCKAQSWSF